ncbi:bifunctional aminotransferase class I/II-fold pyridoxal phosphate-dependent enzyme/GNAT family N-acetyltransferase [Hyalangium sp.]|uniref:bifunctional aminotransferase class I/II-fold pyridoxal phosphate-dependent enzyme/GNAT family N-acetyltransferase n=1 Tax=Hyalangium sp. TaxID=2028555 RepID=UPI002D4A4EB0|nr:bifunctional aminotransferase class I/II-fold pyridoxal phosphate-dependent enzyme/GNAT family N-acetyltransferase [Hyalangium sp.]HYH98020.1 bifunctional aminotransferase class I/II-fold pyridoxal phosphate-dependent enzyme/GNAT family N-acetyltransferase [Hyalangium sp.]
MEASERNATVDSIHQEAIQHGLYFLNPDDQELHGRTFTLKGQELLSFASCSYLGLEQHPQLVEGVIQAVRRYGTQFSATRGFVSAPPYAELEELMSQVLGGYAIVCSSTSLGHQSALGVLATEKDAIVLDHQAHFSIQQAAQLTRTAGCHVEIVKHGELERALEAIQRLAAVRKTVWFAVDGVYSMYGDLVPVELLREALKIAPNVRLYVDDAHGMSWAGKHGRGSFLTRMGFNERIVLATSMNKAFAAGGGCLLFATDKERQYVRKTGGPLFFSGPLQPPMLGAAMASARLHLSPEIYKHQEVLQERIQLANRLIREAGLPLLVENETPIFFLRLGLPRLGFKVARRMMDEGIYVTPSVYPTVPMRRGGIRLSLTGYHTAEDVTRVIERLAVHIPSVLGEEGLTVDNLDDEFRHALPGKGRLAARPRVPLQELIQRLIVEHDSPEPDLVPAVARPVDVAENLTVERYSSIWQIDKELWNSVLGTVGFVSWDSLMMQEQVFTDTTEPENAWQFIYVLVRDRAGRVLAAAPFTVALCKDDMLMREEVSQRVEERRKNDPYFLSSKALLLGTLLSEGNHLYLDRTGPWRAALARLLEAAREEFDRNRCTVMTLRDLPADDAEMDQEMLHHGLVKVPMLDSHMLNITWWTEDEYLNHVKRSKREHLKERIKQSRHYERRMHGVGVGETLSLEELEYLHSLYLNVARKSMRLNVFHLPVRLLAAMHESSSWELMTLRLDPAHGGPQDGRPVAFCAAHKQDGHYGGFLCGVDYEYVYHHGAYRQLLYQLIRRAMELGMKSVHLGMTADMEKIRFGSVVQRTCVYMQARDHFNGALLREIAAEASLGGPQSFAASPDGARPG